MRDAFCITHSHTMKLNANSILIGAIFLSVVNSLSIRDFVLNDFDDDEPDHSKYAAVARYVVHKSDWTAMGTISTLKNITGYPLVNLKSVADSVKGEPSTGNIYFYMATEDFSARDLMKDNRLTVMFSNEQDHACTNKGVDPMDPTCARVIMAGSAVKLDINSEEYKFGNRAFLSRHPAAADWVKAHGFVFCKVDITFITVLDWYGGPSDVNVKDYYNVKDGAVNSFLTKSHRSNEGLVLEKGEDKIRIKIKRGENAAYFEV